MYACCTIQATGRLHKVTEFAYVRLFICRALSGTARCGGGAAQTLEDLMVQGRTRDEKRAQWIRALRAKGWTYSRIAREAGVTRQAIHHALAKSSRKHIIARCRKCRKPFP